MSLAVAVRGRLRYVTPMLNAPTALAVSAAPLRATLQGYGIDFDALAIPAPYTARDLPAGGQRMMQDARGYAATIVNGVVTRRDDADTGARPGRLVRGARER